MVEAEARREAGETGGETGARGRGGRSSRSRGRGVRPPAGGRGAGSSGQGEGSTQAPETAETSASPGLPSLEWMIGVRDSSGARVVIGIPRLPIARKEESSRLDLLPSLSYLLLLRTQPEDTTSVLVSASTRGRGTQKVSRSATEARQFEVFPRAASQRRPAPQESEEETEESLESRALGSTDSSTASGSPGDDDDDDDGDDRVECSKSEGHQRKRTRRD
ncbi:hypothetical protein RHMOL_Rhmol10G0178100 [Rhododendron molle]|uniref:Uncharacterized protein n=1 Tax=Rhododendron molle TaxID=49168 RepID=A0ACC0M3K8_RHOML|nr:hypothetical protein RHMOL_Rhmol10G0178100 [Rhododendron molle]